MTEPSPDAPDLVNYIQQAAASLANIEGLENRALQAASSAEEFNRKANSEAGYAFNAKQVCEDHAKAIAQVRGAVDADANWLTTTKANLEAAAEAAASLKADSIVHARQASEARATAESELALIRTASERVASLASSAEQSARECASAGKRSGEDSSSANASKAAVDVAATAVQAAQSQVADLAAAVQVNAQRVAQSSSEAQTIIASLVEVAETAKASTAKVVAYEKSLEALVTDFSQIRAKIESLLPGATSAGLASAFRDQQQRFDRPQIVWLATFVAALLGLLTVGLLGAHDLAKEALTWDSIMRHVASRLPVAVPLIWLALYAGRHYTTALRLQEDYAFKEAISTSFEGYRREMASITVAPEQLAPLLTLCDNVLKTLGQRPGRLYDGNHDDVTPLSPVTKLLKDTKLLDKISLGTGKQSD